MQERFKFLLLMAIEALFLLLLISRKLLQVTTLLQVQSVVLLLLMGTEGCPVLLPPRLVEIILIQFRCSENVYLKSQKISPDTVFMTQREKGFTGQ